MHKIMTITLTREEAQSVLDALEQLDGWDTATQGDIVFDPSDEIEILRARLSAPKPEPIGWIYEDDEGRITFSQMPQNSPLWEPVYKAAPKRNFKFSTIEEAKQPMPTPTGQPQLTDDESRFADAFIALQKAGYGKEAEIVLKFKPRWQGLTDEEEIEDEWERITGHSIFGGERREGRAMYLSPDEVIEFARAIEAKLKEKNT